MTHDNADPVQLGSHYDDPQPTDAQPTSGGIIVLPTETIYHILRFLGPQDLIRLQIVSKFFRTIILDPALWRTVYSTARLPLPPGPFPWQSIQFLQRALINSARLANSWTTEPLSIISSKIYTGPRSIDDDRLQWVCGRWLIVSKGMKQLWSRDVETGSERVLWDRASFVHWDATSVMTPQRHFIYVALHLERGYLEDPVKLLEFTVDDDTGYLEGPEMFDVPTWSLPREAFTPRIRVDGGNAPYVYVSLCSVNKPRHSLVFDPRHRRFHKFPRFRTRLDMLLNYRGAWLPHLVEVYFTRTHLFVLSRSYLIHGNLGGVEVVQTFAFPEVDSNPGSNGNSVLTGDTINGDGGVRPIVRELRLTHEMLSRDMGSSWLALIRDATVDPVTQSTTLRFMHTYAPIYRTPGIPVRLVCTDYVLPATPRLTLTPTTTDDRDGNNDNRNLNAIVHSDEEVVPITTVSHDIFSIPGMWRGNLVHTSYDGFVRGLCGVESDVGSTTTTSNVNEMVHKFAVDATRERCVAIVADPSPPWEDLDLSLHYEYTLDAMRGKIWYVKGGVVERNLAGELLDRDVLAIVVDFK